MTSLFGPYMALLFGWLFVGEFNFTLYGFELVLGGENSGKIRGFLNLFIFMFQPIFMVNPYFNP